MELIEIEVTSPTTQEEYEYDDTTVDIEGTIQANHWPPCFRTAAKLIPLVYVYVYVYWPYLKD